MGEKMDVNRLREISRAGREVYDALLRAQTLTEEGRQLKQQADALLQQAGLTYLLGENLAGLTRLNEPKVPPIYMAGAYMQVQQAYAGLMDALYRCAQSLLQSEKWLEARTLLETLERIEPGYRDAKEKLRQSYVDEAAQLFKKSKWEEGYQLLRAFLSDRKIRLAYVKTVCSEIVNMSFSSFGLSPTYQGDSICARLQMLLQDVPEVSSVSSFQKAFSIAQELRTTDYRAMEISYGANWQGAPFMQMQQRNLQDQSYRQFENLQRILEKFQIDATTLINNTSL